MHQGIGRRRPKIRAIMNSTRKIKKRILAMDAAAPAIPPKPKKAAIIAMIKKTTAQYNMVNLLYE
jgi:hypothetical protein